MLQAVQADEGLMKRPIVVGTPVRLLAGPSSLQRCPQGLLRGPQELHRASSRSLLRGPLGLADAAATEQPRGVLRVSPKLYSATSLDLGVYRVPSLASSQDWALTREAMDALLRTPSQASALASVKAAPLAPNFGAGDGAAPTLPAGCKARGPDFSWIRHDNSQSAREARRSIRDVTLEAVAAGGYTARGREVALVCVKAMVAATEILAPSLGNLVAPTSRGSHFSSALVKSTKTVLDAAMDIHSGHAGKVGVVSAASAYHCGGGFASGGRHALEEALCAQSTLQQGLEDAWARARASQDDHKAASPYIPADGVVLTPKVEIFRRGADEGYPFMEQPLELAAVISVAMFNRNKDIKDAPMDAPTDSDAYAAAVRLKLHSVLAAAVKAGCVALVVPDAGCGVYMNDPELVGRTLGEVLRDDFQQWFKEVIVTGSEEFQKAAEEAFKKRRARDSERSSPASHFAGLGGESASPQPSAGSFAQPRTSPPPPPLGKPSAFTALPNLPAMPAARSERLSAGGPLDLPPMPTLYGGSSSSSPGPALPARGNSPRPGGQKKGRRKGNIGSRGEGKGHSQSPPRNPFSPPHEARLRGDPDGLGGHVTPPQDTPLLEEDATPRLAALSPSEVVICKFGCGRRAPPGTTRSGKPFDTCCRLCAKSHGNGMHDDACDS